MFNRFMWTLHTRNSGHWVPIKTVASFKRMREFQPMGSDWLVNALRTSETLEVDVLIWAIGRHANTEGLGLEALGVKLDKHGNVIVDEYQETGVPGINALGDVAGKALLTPVAIAAARRLSNRLFGPEKFKDQKLDYDNIPTVVFSCVSFLPPRT